MLLTTLLFNKPEKLCPRYLSRVLCLNRYNIRYGRVESTDVEVEEASKNADIHDSVVNFPDGKCGVRTLPSSLLVISLN